MDTLIRGGAIVTSKTTFQGNIGITDGVISHILDPEILPQAREVIHAEGLHIIPGLIDEHIHFNDPGTVHREDFDHGTRACAVGGITTAIAMPTNIPLILNKNALEENLRAWQGRGYVDYAVHGGLDQTSAGDVEALWRETGVAAIKVFLCESSPDMGWVRDDLLYSTMKALAAHDGVLIIHAENNELISLHEKLLRDAGRTDPAAHSLARPPICEVEAVRRVICFVKETGVTTLFPHISTAQGLEEIHKARAEGVPVYAESCPQYFTFTDQNLAEQGPYLKFTPPIHDEENRQAMLELLKKGYVNHFATDHSPYTLEEKQPGEQNIWEAPNGIPGLETLLPRLLDLASQGYTTLEQIVRMTSEGPAELFRLPGKGKIQVGYDADLVIVDTNLADEYREGYVQSKNKWSPYLGRTFHGWPVRTLLRGKTIAQNHQVVGEQGYGRYVACPKAK